LTGKISIRSVTAGPLAVNCYLVFNENIKHALVIDPGGDGPVILRMAKRNGVKISMIINTHGHCDHIGANSFIRDKTGAKIGIHKLDEPLLNNTLLNGAQRMCLACPPHTADFTFEDGDHLQVGGFNLKIIHTPGHTNGCCCFFIEGTDSDPPILFSGDTLFAGGIGRTDYYGGDETAIYKSLKRLIEEIPPSTMVYPGHGPACNFGDESERNPFLLNLIK